MSPVDPDSLNKSIALIKKAYEGKEGGTGKTIQFGDEEPPIQRISTGSYELDWATCGGIPVGRLSRFFGSFSSGKSLTCWNVIRNAQQMGMTCAYYNIEKQYHRDYVEALGVDTKKLLVVQGTQLEATGAKLEELMGAVHLHVVDSGSSAVSIEELNANVEDWTMGLKARVWGKVLRRVMERFDENENSIILVDQVRDSIGGGGGVEPPGGRFIEHTSSLSLLFRKGKWLFRGPDGRLDPDNTPGASMSQMAEADGMEIQVRVEKNRTGRPFRTARLHYEFPRLDPVTNVYDPGGLDLPYELTKAAVHFGVVEKTSAQSSYYKRADGKDFSDGSKTKQGQLKLMETISTDKDLEKQIIKAMERNY